MKKDNTEFFKQTEKWFAAIPDKTENGLRAYLKGERPADAGTSVTQKASNKSALLIYNYDLEAVRYKLRRKFSESAIFDRQEIKYLKQAFSLNQLQAEAVRFVGQTHLNFIENKGLINICNNLAIEKDCFLVVFKQKSLFVFSL